MEDFKFKFSDKNDMESEKKLTLILTFKVMVPNHLTSILDDLYDRSKICVDRMIQNRDLKSSKYYKEIPCALSKSLIAKYQRNKKLKSVKKLVLPICGDKGRQVKIEKTGIRVPSFFKKEVLPVVFPKPIVGFIRQVEFFKKNKVWYMSYSYNTPVENLQKPQGFIGVDRNAVGNVVFCSNAETGLSRKIGPDVSSITRNLRNRKSKLQKRGKKNALVKINKKQSRRVKDINHKVSRSLVDLAKEHCSAIVLEDLGKISKKGKAKRYVQKAQWSFFQLETFILYKAALLGIPVIKVNPAYTSQRCSRCGDINKPNGKHYTCSKCGYFAHRDSNAAFNISALGKILYEQTSAQKVVGVRHIGGPLNWRAVKAVQPESSGGAR